MTCILCNEREAREQRRTCTTCQARQQRATKQGLPVLYIVSRGHYCRCGCGAEAWVRGLSRSCYRREQTARRTGRWNYLDQPFTQSELVPLKRGRWTKPLAVHERPTPYRLPEPLPDDLLMSMELSAAIEQLEGFSLAD